MKVLLEQKYSDYTEQDHQVWSILFDRQMRELEDCTSASYLKGIERIGFLPDKIPDFKTTDERLKATTGWGIRAVPGIVEDAVFFELLFRKLFPSTVWIRSKEQLDYLEEPDMFHDVFGHMPLLTDPDFCKYLQGLGKIGLDHIHDAHAIELLSRIYWFTVEFGLINENDRLKIYGAGIISSAGESVYALSNNVPKKPFDVPEILNTNYIKSEYQKLYYVIENYEQLYQSLPEVEKALYSILENQIRK